MSGRNHEWRRLCEGILGVPATEGNRIEVLRNGDEIFPAMLDAIEAAERTVDLLTYVYWSGEIAVRFADALAERARAGVRVRVLLDALGAHDLDDELVERMSEAGCDVRWFRPMADGEHTAEVNHRTHRKVMVCDELVGFTGGVGIADEWSGDARDEREWRDTHFRVEGPAVDGLRSAFIDNWVETGAPPLDPEVDRLPDAPRADDGSVVQVVRGAAEVGQSDMATLFWTLIANADRCVRITTAYFTPDDDLASLIRDTVERGVEVQLLVPGPHHDKRFVQMASEALFEELMEAGVQIQAFQPAMLHAKILTIDGEVATVGSSNLNSRSMSHDEEVNLVLFDPRLVAELDRHFDEDLERSERLDPSTWADRSVFQRIGEKLTDGASSLL